MKETMLKRIHGIGKAGAIISRICRVFLIIGFVGVLIGLMAVLVLPNNFVTVEIGGTVGVKVDFSKYGGLSAENRADLEKQFDRAMQEKDEDFAIRDYKVEKNTISLDFVTGENTFRIRNLVGPLIVALLYLAASYVTMWFVGKLCTAFRGCASPFDGEVIRRMKNFAYSLIPWVVLSWVSDGILSDTIPFANHSSGGFDLKSVLLILLILGLCAIFRYGAELQREHDETL